MSLLSRAALTAVVFASPLAGQQDPRQSLCASPDSVIVYGTRRTSPATVASLTGIKRGDTLTANSMIVRAIGALYGTGDYASVQVDCEILAPDKAALAFTVVERPVLASIRVEGPHVLSQTTVEDRVELLLRRPVDPALVTKAITRIDSLYMKAGFYLARIVPETTVVDSGSIGIVFKIDEGRRMSVSGLTVLGAKGVPASDVAGAMKVKPEGLWWFRKGEFDDEKYAGDLGERIPALYSQRGYIDFQLISDSLIVDRERAKSMIQLEISEGAKYRVGSFSMSGHQHFTDDFVRRFYPFGDDGPSLMQRAKLLVGKGHYEKGVFNQAQWDTAAGRLSEAYQNDGYIYARVAPEFQRAMRGDTAVVNLHFAISEGTPAMVNRVDVAGNDYTTEHCIRDVISMVPGDVFRRSELIRSWQNINNLGFFESVMPQTEIANEAGDQNVRFDLKEKRTGNINFGASMGQGVGIGGFFGIEQPNVFGRCKRASMNWNFGRYINDFNLSYTDPAIKRSRYSGTISAYRSEARYQIADLGRTTRIGGSVRLGVPIKGSLYTRTYVSYTGESVSYGAGGLAGTIECDGSCFRSSMGLDVTRDTRFGMPFPIGGGMQSISAQFNGGPLGGSANFQRYSGESRAYVPLKQWGGEKTGQPVVLALALSTRAGAVFGNTGPFFFSPTSGRFALGGVQFGEPLRGYPEFSITPKGFITGTSTYNAQRESFGSAFFANTIEMG
ncbi:MAG TPA: outer membrane protein assembly factor BamA, partial [Gemmatimonadaceae bacterium]|nr:outer membrane protein assembly factor BamA [Gemmatimonadaceae bacterium]